MSLATNVNSSNQKVFALTTYDRVNQSPSQAKYTFSKADRFPSLKKDNPVSCYDIPNSFSTRAASLGYGTKRVFNDTKNSPSPDKYKLTSVFDTSLQEKISHFGKQKKSFCFGAGRENFTKTVYNTTNMFADPIVPGPGTYTDETTLIGVNTRKTTLKERKFYLDVAENALKQGVPGPGTYQDQQAMDSKGIYASSQMTNSRAARINTGRRFRDEKERSPAPGTYNELGNIASGVQVCTNFHSTITKNIGTTDKRTRWGGNPRFKTPGPGAYRPPSDFGYLDFKNQLRELDGSMNTGLDTSMQDANQSLKLGKMDSMRSDRRHRNNSVNRTLEMEQLKKHGGQSSRNAINTQQSTLYSMNNSLETPTSPGAGIGTYYTPMTNMDLTGSQKELRTSPRQTKTPQGKGLQKKSGRKNKKASHLKEMVVIYGDLVKNHRQEAHAAGLRNNQLKPQNSTTTRSGVVELEPARHVSELGTKPSSGNGERSGL